MKEVIKKYAEIIHAISSSNIKLEKVERYLETIAADFQLKNEEDIRILADSLNELSNKNAVTVDQLLEALYKASVLASNKNLTLDELSLYVKFLGSSRQETGKIIGNSLKTILTRLTSNENSKEVLKSAGIENFENVKEVVDELVSKWSSLSKEEKKDIAVKVAGRYQMARFIILFNRLTEEDSSFRKSNQ